MCPRGNLGVKNKNTKTPVRMGSKGATTAAPPTFIFLRKRLIKGGHSGEHLTEPYLTDPKIRFKNLENIELKQNSRSGNFFFALFFSILPVSTSNSWHTQ